MIENYQQEKEKERKQPKECNTATVVAIYDEGIILKYDDSTENSTKPAITNTSIVFEVGQRVLVQKIGGAYVVICPIGRPRRG